MGKKSQLSVTNKLLIYLEAHLDICLSVMGHCPQKQYQNNWKVAEQEIKTHNKK
jgi:hypothetical protein